MHFIFFHTANCELPKGSNVFVSPYITHRCPQLYPDPDSFNPENFSPENESRRHKFSFLAFSGGPRGCLGTQYTARDEHITVSHLSLFTRGTFFYAPPDLDERVYLIREHRNCARTVAIFQNITRTSNKRFFCFNTVTPHTRLILFDTAIPHKRFYFIFLTT